MKAKGGSTSARLVGWAIVAAGTAAGCGDPEDTRRAPALASFAAAPSTVVAGEATSVRWSWTFETEPSPAAECSIDRAVGAMTSGGTSSVTLDTTTTFTLTCTNAAGEDSAQSTITVTPAPVAPELASFTAAPATVVPGEPTSVTWAWTFAGTPSPSPACTIDNGVGSMISGGVSFVTLDASTTYTLTCTNSAGSDAAQATISTVPPVAPELATFTAEPSTVLVASPTPVTWTWTYSNSPVPAPACTIDHGVGPLTSGSVAPVTLADATVFTLTCTNAAGSDTAETTVETSPALVDALVGAGGSFACATLVTGGVRCWGSNHSGELGDGSTTGRAAPADVPGLAGVTDLGLGLSHSCAVLPGGALHCWGGNVHGELGDGSTTDRPTPGVVPGLAAGVTLVAAGEYHTCAALAAGGVRCWGGNFRGQVGDGTTTDRLVPTPVAGLTETVTALEAGNEHTCALLSDGTVRCWGFNDGGQLGDGTRDTRSSPVVVSGLAGAGTLAAGGRANCVLLAGGQARCWGFEFGLVPVDVPALASGVESIGIGETHICALLSSGDVRCRGNNTSGALGDWTTTYSTLSFVDVLGLDVRPTAVVAGGRTHADAFTCVVQEDGGASCWGDNAEGQLGDGTTNRHPAPIALPTLSAGVDALGVGRGHACALDDGTIRCWGDNSYGQLGNGTMRNVREPTAVTGLPGAASALVVAGEHTCALVSGAAYCWGRNYDGQLGNGSTADSGTPVIAAGLGSGVVRIGGGDGTTCALLDTGRVYCWGGRYPGDGVSDVRRTPVEVTGLSAEPAAFVGGDQHTCALLTTGGVECWGGNFDGQAGDGTTTERPAPVPVSGLAAGVTRLVAGSGHTCALDDSGTIRCWGRNESGQLGDGSTVSRTRPVAATRLPTGDLALAAGPQHTCVPQPSGVARCVGGAFGPAISGTADGFDVPGFTPELEQLGVGYWLLCGRTDGGAVECAGIDDHGAVSGFFPGIPRRVLSLGP